MDSFWNILELEPTQDVSAIKRAYAAKSRTCHPEDDPDGFLRLREAYQAALDYAQGGEEAAEAAQEPEQDQGWILEEEPKGPNPFADSEAIHQFVELYTGKQRKDPKKWLDYFISAPFLDAAREGSFTQLLLETVTGLADDFTPPREMLNWLSAAYLYTGRRLVYLDPDGSECIEYQFQLYEGGRFEGLENIFEIAKLGPLPKPFWNNELAILTSFVEYRRLCALAEDGEWDEEAVSEFSRIIGCYASSYITDKCQQRRDMDYERHPAGLQVVSHFFERYELPDELYRIVWQKLDLKAALMGRAKIWYGAIRERVLARIPDIGEEKQESFARLKTECIAYFAGCYKRAGSDPELDRRETDALFAREDFRRALVDRRFVEEELLHTFVNEDRCDYYLLKIMDFYRQHPTAPCAGQVVERARQMLALRDRTRREAEAENAPVLEGKLTLTHEAFFRHWINTAFPTARDPESGQYLMRWLNQNLPWQPKWSHRFLNVAEDSVPEPKTVVISLEEDQVEVRFHLQYVEFLLNGELVCRPCLDWDRVAAVEDPDEFCFLLPITVTTYDRYEEVQTVLLERLPEAGCPEHCRDVAAGCIAGKICSMPLPEEPLELDEDDLLEDEEYPGEPEEPLPPEAALPFELFAEDGEHLFGCAWFQREQRLVLFQQNQYGRQTLRDGEFEGVADAEEAAELGRQLLDELVHPTGLPMEELKILPEFVAIERDLIAISREPDRRGADLPFQFSGEEVTPEKLETLLWSFAEGKLTRLEWSWPCTLPEGAEQGSPPRRSLVFLRDPAGYACLFFDDYRAQSFALLARPDLYGKEKGIEFVPFRQGKLFRHDVHRGFTTIRRQLARVFSQVSWPNGVQHHMGGRGIWDWAENVTHGRRKYNVDKQLLGGFAPESAQNSQDARFYFYTYPDTAVWMTSEGKEETLAVGELDRDRLQHVMVQFLGGAWPQLRLTWDSGVDNPRHIVLLHEEGRFMLAWIDEAKRQVAFHVADTYTYMDVEGKKYPRAVLQGRTVGAYLVHDGAKVLRNALELLLANLDDPARVINKFAEYAEEKPVKARPYEAIWADLVGGMGGT